MPLSYRNIIDGNELSTAIGSGDFSNVIKKPNKNSARYIKGYAKNTALEALANTLNINKGLFQQAFGLEDKKLDLYDPYHTSDAKKENGWIGKGKIIGTDPLFGSSFREEVNLDGKTIQSFYDEDTSTFKRSLYSEFGYGDQDFFYEDPFLPAFELYFDTDSPLFSGGDSDIKNKENSLSYFIEKYGLAIDPIGYQSRKEIWKEFNNVFFKIFETKLKYEASRNKKNKPYYIAKIGGLNFLNKKYIKYSPTTEADKITITLNEDVSMIAWYIAELYNNLAYSYKNQRYMFPENLLRFSMGIKINDVRNFILPKQNEKTGGITNQISKKSQIIYTLHDCSFDFFDSKNYGDDMEIGGFGTNTWSPQSMTFNIYFKSATRWTDFPLQNPLKQTNGSIYTPGSIDGWDLTLSHGNTIDAAYAKSISKTTSTPVYKGFGNDLLAKAGQTVANQALNYMDNLEASLREARGTVVNNALQQLQDFTGLHKIEPDNVYSPEFNNRLSLLNFGKQLGSSLLNDLTDTARSAANF